MYSMFKPMDVGAFARKKAGVTALVLLLGTMLSSDAHAQGSQERDASSVAALAGALVGGVVGAVGGAGLGAGSDCYEICSGLVTGFVVGEVVGVTLGSHLFNRGRGNLGLTFVGSAASVLAVGAVGRILGDGGEILLAALVTQLAVVTVIQVRTSPAVSVSPILQPSTEGMKAGLILRW